VTSKEEKGEEIELGMDLKIRRAREIQVVTKLEDITIDPPPMIGNLLSGPVIKVLENGWARRKIIEGVDFICERFGLPALKELFLPEPPNIEKYEGVICSFLYRSGKGLVKDPEIQDEHLSEDDKRRVRDCFNFVESHIFPTPDPGGPEEWDVDVRDIAGLLVGGAPIDVKGTLRFRRGQETGNIVRLEIVRGLVEFTGSSDNKKTLGSWAARGYLEYDLEQRTVVNGRLSGEVKLEATSTDHILFEAGWAAEPDYQVVIYGYRAADTDDATREIDPVKLK
jgi:hypothetical protein